MAKRETDRKDPSFQAEAVVGAGRGALILSMFGAGLLGWGLGLARAFNAVVGAAFGFTALSLWAWSMYTIRKGRLLRRHFPLVPTSVRRTTRRSFLLVVLVEVVMLAFVFILSNRIHRPDLGADWAALVIGLHYLPLGRIFRAPVLGILGALVTLWSLLCWTLFRSDALVISATLGTGFLVWLASASALLRARKIAQVL